MDWVVIGALAGGLVLVVLSVMVAGRRRERRLIAEKSALQVELARSQAAVGQLSAQVDALGLQLAEARRVLQDARSHQPEYVITSLTQKAATGDVSSTTSIAALLPARTGPAAHLEDQLVGALARHQDVSPFRAHVVEIVVKTVALGHGVRRALSPDVLDRAAAESHVARRRSRRNRKREEREAKRLLRAVKDQRRDQRPGQHAA